MTIRIQPEKVKTYHICIETWGGATAVGCNSCVQQLLVVTVACNSCWLYHIGIEPCGTKHWLVWYKTLTRVVQNIELCGARHWSTQHEGGKWSSPLVSSCYPVLIYSWASTEHHVLLMWRQRETSVMHMCGALHMHGSVFLYACAEKLSVSAVIA